MISKKHITSTFYRILIDNKPVYVGYTNRSIKERFKEHLTDKEFDSGNVTVEQIDKLEFEFTWDYTKILEYAEIVSQKETELINEQNTGESTYQKGLNGKIGGSTWTNIKWFVKTNKDNPKYKNLPEDEILLKIDKYRSDKKYLNGFISDMIDPSKLYLKHFINYMNNPDQIYLKSFIHNMNNQDVVYLRHFISNMISNDKRYIKDFIYHMIDPDKRYLQNCIIDMINPDKKYLRAFINHMTDYDTAYLKHFMSNMVNHDKMYLRTFINNLHR